MGRAGILTLALWVGLTGPDGSQADEIEAEAERFAPASLPVEPEQIAQRFRIPFASRDRSSLAAVRLVSPFGAGRTSHKPGHLHTGADLNPRGSGPGPVTVYPLAAGAVCSIHLTDPHTTVVVVHRLPDESRLYTSYKHLAEVSVRSGQQVDADTSLGRLYTRAETRALGARYDHLHLEVRKRFDDHGCASWLTMTRSQLEDRFLDPLAFLRSRLAIPVGLAAPRAERFIAATRELLEVPYGLGGRLRSPEDGIDCQGLIFYAAERIGRCGWRSYSVMPTETSAWRELGAPVPGLDPVSTRALEADRLQSGDVLWLLFGLANPAEPPIASLAGRPVWVWHSAVYTGGGRFIHADPFSGQVVEQNLAEFLDEYDYDGLWVTRMAHGPRPKRCRIHRLMPRPAARAAPGPLAPAPPGPTR